MAAINPYLTFLGNCEEAFNHYKSVFGGEFAYVGRFKDMPPSEDGSSNLSEDEMNGIMHISLPISQETILMGSDTGGEWASQTVIGNNITIAVNANSKEEADRLFNGLSEGGHITMPMSDTFWGDYFGMCIDRFGIPWMMSYNTNVPEAS